MTIPELITSVLHQLRSQFYCDKPARDYLRDEPYLERAIATYGYECKQRSWDFDTHFLYAELSRLLQDFKHSGSEIVWMPVYLQIAIRRHINENAERLHDHAVATRVPRTATKIIDQARNQVVKVVVQPTPVELLASVYQDIRALKRQSSTRSSRRQEAPSKKSQPQLL